MLLSGPNLWGQDADDFHRVILLKDPMNHLEAGDDSVSELRVVGERLAHMRVSSQSLDSLVDLKSGFAGFDQVARVFNLLARFSKSSAAGVVHLIRKSIVPFVASLPRG